jgi:uncharacterized membrane protein HdeD (DUF308 family)
MSAAELQQALPTIWWQVFLRGFISILLGLLILVLPHASIHAYETIFGAYALADGFLLIMQVLQAGKADKKAGSRLLHGLIGVGVGSAALLWPGFLAIGMANIFSTYLLLTGVLQIFTALDLYHVVRHDYYLITSGFLSILCGLWLKTMPVSDTIQLARGFGIFMTAYAVITILIAMEMRRGAVRYSG